MSLSNKAKRNLLATSATEPILLLLEITHQDLSTPIRVVDNSENIVSCGYEFTRMRFDVTFPDDVAEQISGAQLEVDNVGRELTQWLEHSRGGTGAKCRLMAILPSTPDVLEMDVTMDMSGMVITNHKVTASLGYNNSLGLPAVARRYDPTTSPGAFA